MTEAEAVATPVGFATVCLGAQLYDWQAWVLIQAEDTRGRTKISVAAPNGSGKDKGCIDYLAISWLALHKHGKVVITSKDSRQLDEQTMPALRSHADRLPGWKWNERRIESPTGGTIILFTTDEPGRAEGWHKDGDTEAPLLIIVNEAKSVPDSIFQAFDRCTFNVLLYISSTGLMQGRFYDSHTKLAAQYRRRVVKLDECPHIPKTRIDDILKTYGREHPFTKSTLYSEFMSEDEANAFLFRLEEVQRNIQSPPVFFRTGNRTCFCDFAAGGDENVVVLRNGNQISIEAAWRERDTMAAVGRFLMEFNRLGLLAQEIFADEGGLGKVMCDRLQEVGWPINRVNNQSRPFDNNYANRGAEMWFATQAALHQIRLPDDSLLLSQLTTRRIKISSEGKRGLMSKDDMRKAGLMSPDRADAVCGAWANRPASAVKSQKTVFEQFAEDMQDDRGDWPEGMQTG